MMKIRGQGDKEMRLYEKKVEGLSTGGSMGKRIEWRRGE